MSIDLSIKGTNSNSNQSNSLCTYISNGVLSTFNSIHKIPTNLISAWKNGTISQRCMVAAGIIYSTAATVYIIYLESSNTHIPVNWNTHTPIDCVFEIKNNNSLLDQILLEDPEDLSRNYSSPLMVAILKRCENRFHKSGADESSINGVIGMHVCYPLIDRVCKASESMLKMMSKLERIPDELQENVEHIRRNFFCERSLSLL
ncbi:MAG: hypothetical protein ACH349_05190 [Candidatus Rhabdochlamydia sp.]|jgi:hypothetical protein|nr:hypothetical protein [Chlamydiota bacterium]